MGLRFVSFAAGDDAASFSSSFRCSGDVKVAQRGGAQAVNLVEPGEHVLGEKLGFAVGVGGAQGGGFGDGHSFRLAVEGGGGAENKALRPGGEDGFEQGEGGGGVVAEVDFGVLHGFAGFDQGGEVEDAVEGRLFSGCVAKKLFDASTIGDVGFDEFDTGGDQIAAGVAEVIDDYDLVPLAGQERRNCAADISGPARYHDLHKKICPLCFDLR